jgi:hypothetical protein
MCLLAWCVGLRIISSEPAYANPGC